MRGEDSGSLAGRDDLLAYLDRWARRSDPTAYRTERFRRRAWSGARVAAVADATAAELAARGVAPGDRVALHVGDGPLWHAAFFGVLRAGGVAVPLDVSLDPEGLRRTAAEIELRAWCTEAEVPDLALDLPRVLLDWRSGPDGPPPPLPDDDAGRAAEIVLTSGTTGAPRAVGVAHRNLRAVLDTIEAGIEEHRRALALLPPMRLAVSLPLSHLYGQVMGVFVPVLLGARVELLPAMPAPDLARRLREGGAWALASVPRTIELLGRHLRARAEEIWGADGAAERLAEALERPWWRRWAAFARLRRELGLRFLAVVSGGAALERDVEDLWRALGYVVIQGYGLTETAPLVTLNHPFDAAPGSLGRPLPGVDLRIAPDGEILVRGPNVVEARPGGPAVDEEGWLHTGDLGRLDGAGRLRWLGRKGERIVTPAGVNVDPGPVTEALRAREEIADAVVVERPWGEPGAVAAVLLPRPGADPARAVRRANESLPDAARIREWRVWPEPDFPRTPTGKARRPPIVEWLERQAPDEAAEEPAGEGVRLDGTGGDAFTVVARVAAGIGGTDPARLTPDDRLSDVLGSLDRVELATRLESTWGVALGDAPFAGEGTLGDLADDLGAALAGTGGAPGADFEPEPGPAADSAPPSGPAGRAAAPPAEPAAARREARALEVPRARWRSWPPTRAARFLLMEGVVGPLWRSFVDLDATGVERVAGLEPPYLLAANHTSEFDPGAVLYGLPRRVRRRVATTAMWEYFEDARTGALLYPLAVLGLDAIPLVQRGDWRPTLEIAGRVVDRGGCPLVFPEGERTLDGNLLPFRRGIGVLARELHLPIVPCAIAGLLAMLPKGAHWPRGCWRSRARVVVRFGEPLAAPRPDADPERVAAGLRSAIEPLLVEARSALGPAG